MNTLPTIDAERDSLETHVELCAERYANLDERMSKLEIKVDALVAKVDAVKSELNKTLIATGGTIVVALIGCATAVISHLK
jgi:L-rhamnose isomerase